MPKKIKQPKPKKGKTFTGYAPFNWGICYGRVFPTQRDARNFCIEGRAASTKGKTWDDVKGYMAIGKVKVEVL